MYLAGGIIYWIFVSTDLQPWAKGKEDDEKSVGKNALKNEKTKF